MVLAFNKAERGKFIVLAQCAPLSSSAPPGSLGCWPTKHLPAAPAARLAGGALVILTVIYAGAPSHCSSHKLWQLQLETTGARPYNKVRVGSAVSPPFELRYVMGSFAFARSREILRVLRPRFHRNIKAIWFTGTTKKSHAYVTTFTEGFLILDHEDPGRSCFWFPFPSSY